VSCALLPTPTLTEEGEILTVCAKADRGRRSSRLDMNKKRCVSHLQFFDRITISPFRWSVAGIRIDSEAS
jgi:hypothetical protein